MPIYKYYLKFGQLTSISIDLNVHTWPHFHKAFQVQDQDHAQV